MNYNNTGSKLKILNILIQKDLDHQLNYFSPKLSGTQTITLLYLFEHQEKIVLQTDLAKILFISHPTARGIIKRLVKLDLIVAAPLSSDRRQVRIRLSKFGKKFMEKYSPKMNQIFKAENQLIHEGISAKDIEQFNQTLDLMINNLKG